MAQRSSAAASPGGVRVYLPPYSPNFNPIENAFAKLKALMRAKDKRTIAGLWDTVGAVLERFTAHECANHLTAAGYDPIEPAVL